MKLLAIFVGILLVHCAFADDNSGGSDEDEKDQKSVTTAAAKGVVSAATTEENKKSQTTTQHTSTQESSKKSHVVAAAAAASRTNTRTKTRADEESTEEDAEEQSGESTGRKEVPRVVISGPLRRYKPVRSYIAGPRLHLPAPAPWYRYGQSAPAPLYPYGQSAPAPRYLYGQSAPAPWYSYEQSAPAPWYSYGQSAPVQWNLYGQSAPVPWNLYGQSAPPTVYSGYQWYSSALGRQPGSSPPPVTYAASGLPAPASLSYGLASSQLHLTATPSVSYPAPLGIPLPYTINPSLHVAQPVYTSANVLGVPTTVSHVTTSYVPSPGLSLITQPETVIPQAPAPLSLKSSISYAPSFNSHTYSLISRLGNQPQLTSYVY